MLTSSSVRRACGRRIRGGIYAETRLSDEGVPIEYFIVDPPTPVEIDQLGLAAVGVQLIEIDGVTHLLDVVGQEYYPYPADYVEETRRLGASRRLPANLDYSRLGLGSRLLLIHARAMIENFTAYPQPPQLECPKGKEFHGLSPLPEMCAGLWWHDLPGPPDENGYTLRQIEGGTAYRCQPRPVGVVPSYGHGVFLCLPISNLTVIRGGEATERNHQAACVSGLPVYREDE